MRVKHHMSINLNGLLRNYGKKSLKGFFIKENGKECTNIKVGDKIGWCMDNIFDNCVSMIDWLVKNNHFNKEYLKGGKP